MSQSFISSKSTILHWDEPNLTTIEQSFFKGKLDGRVLKVFTPGGLTLSEVIQLPKDRNPEWSEFEQIMTSWEDRWIEHFGEDTLNIDQRIREFIYCNGMKDLIFSV